MSTRAANAVKPEGFGILDLGLPADAAALRLTPLGESWQQVALERIDRQINAGPSTLPA